MRQNPDNGAKELGRNKHLQRRLGKPLGTNKGRDVVVSIRAAFQTLQGGPQLGIRLLSAITSSNPDSEKGDCIRAMVKGLSVMLEKIFGCSLISKLRSILLMEADFNATNKAIYGI